MLLQPFHLIDVGQIPDEELRQRVWSGVMELIQKYVFAREILLHLESIIPLIQALETLRSEGLITKAVRYTLYGAKMDDPEPVVNLFKNHLSREVGEEAMTIAEKLEQRGMEKGMQQGMQEGRAANQAEVARNLLSEGTNPSFVAHVTGLSLDQVEALVKHFSSAE